MKEEDAMMPGPDMIVACPHCQTLARYGTLHSGNTFGATQWTDGKMIAPMLPRPPEFVRCRECRGFYWLDQATPVGELPGPFGGDDEAEVRPEWVSAPEVEEPTESGYHEALAAGSIEPERELDFRILAWWRGNDAFRGLETTDATGDQAGDAPVDAEARRLNLEVLAALLAGADENLLVLRVEALRQLGRFDEALVVLESVEGDDYEEVTSALRRYCEAGDPELHEL
jgi:hypothetical protein